ncbi:suppressor of fused domain protein [Kordia sp.]|uniref:suppressor of fused domain protein n=1 Tax=Kordia sp. TaxID=1965332 RepID=UPI003D6B4FDF
MTTYKNPFANRKYYDQHAEWIGNHLNTFYSDAQTSVFHEISTFDLHLDVYFIQPKNSTYNILLTSGMSTLKMDTSKESEFAELMIIIPKEVEFDSVYTGEKKNDWIITMLKRTARFPHYYDTWIEIGHTIQANEDFTPYSNETKYAGALILPSVTFGKDFTEIHKNDRKINIYTIFPLYKNEIEFKIENGYHKLLDLIIKANNKEVLNLNRKNLIPKKSIWGKFLRK